jgi:hypothetical protein
MRIIHPTVGRKVLSRRERIAICLGYADKVNFEDERCRGAAGVRELPIGYLRRARDRLIREFGYEGLDFDRHVIICYQRAADWCWAAKGLTDKAMRLALITPECVLLRDKELAKHLSKHCGPVERKRINELRCELWAVLLLVKDEVVA